MNGFDAQWLLLCVMFVTAFGLWRFLRIAAPLGLMDRPNHRSQHVRETPVGAGIVSAITFAIGLWLTGSVTEYAVLPLQTFSVLVVGLAVVGLLDDRFHLPSTPRLLAYFIACGCLVYLGLPNMSMGLALGLIVFFTWHVNAYNFMDGLDGLAVTQALVVASGMLLVTHFTPEVSTELPWICALLIAALIPLWVINWPPAKVFMGDSGAVSMGLSLAIVAVVALRESLILFVVWWILMAPFLCDASATLLIRLMQGKAPHIAHREHAYQRLARRSGSALTVNLALLAVHLVWQFPLVLAALYSPQKAWIPVILAPIPTLMVVAHLQRSA